MISQRQKIIRAFLSEEPYLLSFEYRRKDFKEVKPLLEELIKEGLIKQVEKTTKTILYKYIGEEGAPKSASKIKKSKIVQSKRELIPLYTIKDGGYFRIPGKRKKIRKRDNLQTIAFQDYLPDKTPVINTKPGCTCVDSSGRISAWDWYIMVEEAD